MNRRDRGFLLLQGVLQPDAQPEVLGAHLQDGKVASCSAGDAVAPCMTAFSCSTLAPRLSVRPSASRCACFRSHDIDSIWLRASFDVHLQLPDLRMRRRDRCGRIAAAAHAVPLGRSGQLWNQERLLFIDQARPHAGHPQRRIERELVAPRYAEAPSRPSAASPPGAASLRWSRSRMAVQ